MKFSFKTICKLILVLVALCHAIIAAASQEIEIKDGGTYKVKVSSSELSRFTVQDGRIDKAGVGYNSWDAKPDKDSGELFIKPRDSNKSPFSFFLRDSFGNTVTLIAMPMDIPSETITLKPATKKVARTKDGGDAGQAFVDDIKTLIKDMVSGNLDPYLVEDMGDDVPLWKEAKITFDKRYTATTLVGEQYTLTNISGGKMTLDEREFASFGDQLKAVSLEKLVLEPAESTRLFIVRGL